MRTTNTKLGSQAFTTIEDQPPSKVMKMELSSLPKFPHPFRVGDYLDGRVPKTTIELEMMSLSASIREKMDWEDKMNNEEIVTKWEKEALSQGASKELFNYVMAELKYYNSLKEGQIEPSTVDGVWQADGYIPEEIKQELIKNVTDLLENVPDSEKDWHPGSNNQVLDLVHPSMFCLVDGVSRQIATISDEEELLQQQNSIVSCLDKIGSGEVTEFKRKEKAGRSLYYRNDDYSQSEKFQWLPSEVTVDTNGKAKFESYINNLHPIWHQALYNPIERIFEKCIPLFNKVLTDVAQPERIRVKADCYSWYDHLEEPDYDEDYTAWEEYRENRQPQQPSIPEFEAPKRLSDRIVNLCGRRLQVIVKLANIILTPENSSYPGGSWHVEGMINEHIVASGIYYYVSENITESRLAFRDAVSEPAYEQNDNNGVSGVYGLDNDLPLSQSRGSVITKEDRLIAFPNIMQHRVDSFELADKTKPGYRKILVFFLVDPNERIISTLHVPPQQKTWYHDILVKTMRKLVPPEIVNKFIEYLDFPLSVDASKANREELMKERKYFVKSNTELFFERPFSLCEH